MIVLGSTGSIGKNALVLASRFNIKIHALACGKNYDLLNEQIEIFKPKFVFIADESLAKFVKHDKVFSGDIEKFLKICYENFGKTKLINALVGFAGLLPSKIAQDLGFELCLANKESLVIAGKFLKTKEISPIDSEHFGLKFLLKDKPDISKLTITASGGATRDMSLKELENLTPLKALNHPNWSMGAKITIDSASMANKLFEVIEAFWLYKVKNIEALIERSSQIHALISFKDGSSTAHICNNDMKLAIAHAIGFGDREILTNIDFLGLKPIKFEEINLEKYPIFSLKDKLLNNTDLGVLINAANEIGVYEFLKENIKFTQISEIIFKTLDHFGDIKISEFNELLELDFKAREFAKKAIN